MSKTAKAIITVLVIIAVSLLGIYATEIAKVIWSLFEMEIS